MWICRTLSVPHLSHVSLSSRAVIAFSATGPGGTSKMLLVSRERPPSLPFQFRSRGRQGKLCWRTLVPVPASARYLFSTPWPPTMNTVMGSTPGMVADTPSGPTIRAEIRCSPHRPVVKYPTPQTLSAERTVTAKHVVTVRHIPNSARSSLVVRLHAILRFAATEHHTFSTSSFTSSPAGDSGDTSSGAATAVTDTHMKSVCVCVYVCMWEEVGLRVVVAGLSRQDKCTYDSVIQWVGGRGGGLSVVLIVQ